MADPVSTFHDPGSTNSFIPSHGFTQDTVATNKVVAQFSRNVERFKINRYAQLIPNSAASGFYAIIDTDDAMRVVNQEDYLWADGDDAPKGTQDGLRWQKFTTERRAYPFTIGHRTRANASWDIVASHSRSKLQLAMTDRTVQALTALTTTGNWSSNTVADLSTLLGGSETWDTSSATDLFIQETFQNVVETIIKGTGGAVSVENGEISLIINPTRAHTIARTGEVRSYITANESAVPFWQQTGVFSAYGLPPMMYGVNIIVEDAVKVTSRKGASSSTRSFCVGDNQAIFVSRVGGVTAAQGPNISTCLGFMHEEMTVETKDDPDNRRVMGRVVEDRDFVVAAPLSGYFIQDVST